ncbi:hypothetical protein D3C72_862440 [compost metagenome]
MQDVTNSPGNHTEENQQTEQRRIFAAYVSPDFAFGKTGFHGKSIAPGGQVTLRNGQVRRSAGMNLAIGGYPVRANLQHQQGIATDQAQGINQVITIEGRQCAFFSFAQPVHQHGGVGRYRIAAQEP